MRKFLMPSHPLTNFEIQKYYQIEPKFNGVYSRNNWSKIKDGTFIINLDQYEWIGAHCIALHVNGNNLTYLDSFVVEHIPKKISKLIGNKNFIKNIYRIQEYDSVISKYLCIGFIDFTLKDKGFLEYHEKNDKIIIKYL